MSVVNKMLRDLESREATSGAQANYQPPQRKGSSTRRLAMITLVGAALIALVLFWPQKTKQSTPPSAGIKPINQIDVAPQTAAPTATDETTTESALSAQTVVQGSPTEYSPARNPAESTQPVATIPVNTSAASSGLTARVTDTGALFERGSDPDAANSPQVPRDEPLNSTEPLVKPSEQPPQASLKVQIRQAIAQNDTASAIRLFANLIKLEPDNIGARKRLAALYFSAGRTDDAQQLLQQTVRLVPADSSVRLMYARLLVQQNDTALAYQSLQEIDQQGEPFGEPFGEPSLELLGYRASLAQNLALFDNALLDYARLIKRDANTAKWWLGQAVVADKSGYQALALRSYRQALNLQQLSTDIEAFIRERITFLTGVAS